MVGVDESARVIEQARLLASRERGAEIIEYIGMGAVILALILGLFAVLDGSGGDRIGEAISDAMEHMAFSFDGEVGEPGMPQTGSGEPGRPYVSSGRPGGADTAEASVGVFSLIARLFGAGELGAPEVGEPEAGDSSPGQVEAGEGGTRRGRLGEAQPGKGETSEKGPLGRFRGWAGSRWDDAKGWVSERWREAKAWASDEWNGVSNWWNRQPDWFRGLIKGIGIGLAVAAMIAVGIVVALGTAGFGLPAYLALIGAVIGGGLYGGLIGGDQFNWLHAALASGGCAASGWLLGWKYGALGGAAFWNRGLTGAGVNFVSYFARVALLGKEFHFGELALTVFFGFVSAVVVASLGKQVIVPKLKFRQLSVLLSPRSSSIVVLLDVIRSVSWRNVLKLVATSSTITVVASWTTNQVVGERYTGGDLAIDLVFQIPLAAFSVFAEFKELSEFIKAAFDFIGDFIKGFFTRGRRT